jgi:IS30 family transposase
MCVTDWAKKIGVDKATIARRIKRGWATADVLAVGSAGAHRSRRTNITGRRAKLTAGDVVEIRRQSADGATTARLAAAFGVTRGAIRQLLTGQTWRSVEC